MKKNLYLCFLGILNVMIFSNTFAQPPDFKLHQNEPNPFDKGGTQIRHELNALCFNRLWIEDTNQNIVKILVSEQRQAGYYWVFWDARNEQSTAESCGLVQLHFRM